MTRRARLAKGIGAALLLAALWFGPLAARGEPEVRITDPEIRESSGLARSHKHAGVFWTHNDSGDRARIFAINAKGKKLAEFQIERARNVDWEAIASDDAGHLFLADIGNNDNRRRDLVVYRIAEPDPAQHAGSVRAERRLRLRYADQKQFPPGKDALNFDAESLIWLDGSLYIFTKHRSDTRTTVYRLADQDSEDEQVLEPLGSIELGGVATPFGNATDASVSPDGRSIALLTYGAIHLFERRKDAPLPSGPITRIDLDPFRTRQVESIAWDGKALIYGNEQGMLFRIAAPLERRRPAAAGARHSPAGSHAAKP